MTMAKDAPMAPLVNHLWPLITQSSPSRTAVVRSVVGSAPDTSGSVIEKQERTSPSTSGFSQRSFCSGVPNCQRISAFPESGACAPHADRPRREEPAARDLVDVDVGQKADPPPASLGGQVRRPHPHRLRPRLQVLHQRLALTAFEQQLLIRVDVLVHERL